VLSQMSLQKLRALSSRVDATLSKCFEALGTSITKRPILTILATSILALSLFPGMIIGGNENNGEKLWTPQDTEAQTQGAWVMSTFGTENRQARVFSTNNQANVLTRESLLGLESLHAGMMQVTAKCKSGSCKGKIVNYTDVRIEQRQSILSIWGDSAPPATLSLAEILADVNNQTKWKTTAGTMLKLADMLGGVQYDGVGKIIGAECFLTSLWLKDQRESALDDMIDPATNAWELELDDFVQGFTHSALAQHQPWTVKGEEEAGNSAVAGDIGMLSIGYVLLIGFSVIVMSHHKRVQSNGMMALVGVGGVGLSIISTFGICGYLGVKTNLVTSVLFLVLLGIGIDDGYVIMGEFGHTKGSPEERVIKAITKAGSSIAVTSVTGIVAFAGGTTSSLPALRDFCIFASVGIFFDFFYQTTFFIGFLVLRARGSANNRPDWLCCIKVDPESTGCFPCPGPVCSRNGQCVCCPCTKTQEDGEDIGLNRRGLNAITNFTMTTAGTIIVAIVTAGLLAGACAGIPNLHVDFDIKWFTPDDHVYADVYKTQDKYFPQTGGLPVYVYTQSGNYAAAHSDGSLAALYERVSADTWIARGISNWYLEFAKDTGRRMRSKASETAFVSELHAFVTSPAGARFGKDISFAMDGTGAPTGINGARTMYIAKETKSSTEQIDMTKTTRASVGGKPLNAFAFERTFLYIDGTAVVDKETTNNIIGAGICVFLVNIVMLADPVAALFVLLMIGSVDICILGYMAHWDLDFNSVTAINLVLAVGLAVDYSAHIAHSFLVAKGSGLQRAKEAIDHVGMSVFSGAFSTFLAILPLGLSKSYIFKVFFKMWFMIVIFGSYFGLIVLPIFLRFLGPCIGAEQAGDPNQAMPEPERIGSTKVADGTP